MDIVINKGGVCTPKGFMAASAAAEIKYKGRDDMAIIASESPCTYAAVFTKNVVKAAPVLWDREVMDGADSVRAVIINSGIANAATGEEGYKACEETAEYAAKTLNFKDKEILLASTGVIGFTLPMDRVKKGIDILKEKKDSSEASATAASKAIMTTDTHNKEISVSFKIGDTDVSIGAMAKGSGMIHPNMGTMLSFVTSDVAIERDLLIKALREVTLDTYNMVSVDGDTSTNDTCMVLCNGMAGNPIINTENDDYEVFKSALFAVNKEIAMMLAGDGEGATALVESRVINALTKDEARILAKSVITSSLTKAAIFGHDANWGRIMCALGYSGAEFDPYKIDIYVESEKGKIKLVNNGKACDYSEDEASEVLSGKKVTIISDIKMGSEEATAWGCDLSYDYVKINADYRS